MAARKKTARKATRTTAGRVGAKPVEATVTARRAAAEQGMDAEQRLQQLDAQLAVLDERVKAVKQERREVRASRRAVLKKIGRPKKATRLKDKAGKK